MGIIRIEACAQRNPAPGKPLLLSLVPIVMTFATVAKLKHIQESIHVPR
jgi:hypothetical protein